MDILKTLANSGLIDQLAGQFGLDKSQVESVIRKGLPTITNQINKNTSEGSGLDNFTDALKDHKDRNVSDMLNDTNKVNTTEGGKILDHIFGGRKETVEDEIASTENVSKDKVDGIMKVVAPILMVILAKRVLGPKTETPTVDNTTRPEIDPSVINERTAEANKEQRSSGLPGILNSIFDKDGDGGFLDDLIGIERKK